MANKAGRPKLELNEEQAYKLASLNVTVKDIADKVIKDLRNREKQKSTYRDYIRILERNE